METSSQRLAVLPAALLFLLFGSGCQRGPKPVKPPKWQPAEFADACIKHLDTDQDGAVDRDELQVAPGLLAGIAALDADQNNRVERSEFLERFQLYKDLKVGLRSEYLEVYYRGKPLSGATVKFIPEDFLRDVVEPAEGLTDPTGGTVPTNGIDTDPGVRVGYYRVEITSPALELPAKYNTETTLGVEIAPVSANSGYSRLQFRLK